ncbi:MAG: acyl-CoA dehydrogenase, partial [Gammaproteobacteria bacterium]
MTKLVLLIFLIGLVLFWPTALRRQLLSRILFKKMAGSLPPMSQTEREAMEAGNTWWDAELFTGSPDWAKLRSLPAARLSEAEQAFLDGPVETLCEMLDDWDITHRRRDL